MSHGTGIWIDRSLEKIANSACCGGDVSDAFGLVLLLVDVIRDLSSEVQRLEGEIKHVRNGTQP